ncbi:MAG: 50S ribosomal protein L4 [Candidatus Aenigmatarchaeota archaeon]
MKVDLLDLEGKKVGEIELPRVFQEPLREDLIKRAFLAIRANKRQPYGTDVMAGKRTSAHYHGYRRHRWTMMSREMARMPRSHGKIPLQQMFRARFVPQAVKGREAHPPKVEKIWEQKINKNERKKAIKSAIAATAMKEIVSKRGHRVDKLKDLPLVVEDKIQEIKKSKELIKFLNGVGLEGELERIKESKIRGKKRKKKIGPLIVVAEDKGISRAARNLGLDVCLVQNLNAEILAPGAMPGRLTIWSKAAIEKLEGR